MARVEMDTAALRSIASGPEVLAVLVAKAEQAKRYAKLIAPRRTGDYASRLRIVAAVRGAGVYALLVNDDPGAATIELGARHGHNPRFRVLGRAVDVLRDGT